MRTAVLALLLTSCIRPEAVVCDDGRTCPGGSACDARHKTCVDPEALTSCLSVDDGMPCTAGEESGVCDQHVCVVGRCGDGFVSAPELCDGDALGTGNCKEFGFYDDKVPACNSTCGYDTSVCTGFCGDGEVTAGFEICEDDTIAPTDTCVDYGYGAGVLACKACGPGTDACIPFGWKTQLLPTTPYDINGTSETDVYAGTATGLVHFDGAAWTTVDLAACGSTFHGSLGNVWAVSGAVFGTNSYGEVMRLAGATCDVWTPAGSTPISDVWASSANDAYVVTAGTTGKVYHFDGNGWTMMSPNGVGFVIWGSGPSDVWASTYDGHMLHFNGSVWSSPITVPITSSITSVWGSSPTDVYIGTFSGGNVMRWNGVAWKTILDDADVPYLANGTRLVNAGAAANGRAYVTVGYQTPDRALVLEYDGKGWSNLEAPLQASSPLWGSPSGTLHAVVGGFAGTVAVFAGAVRVDSASPGLHGPQMAAVRSTEVYAAESAPGGGIGTLYRWDGDAWSVAVADPTDVAIAPTGEIFASSQYGGLVQGSGTSWSSPDTSVAGRRLAAIASNNVWLLADGASVYRWTAPGTATLLQWSTLTTEPMNDVWGASANAIFLVGEKGTVLRWNGSALSKTQLTPADYLVSVTGNSATDVYAIGIDFSTGAQRVWHFDGTNWSILPIPPGVIPTGVWGPPNDLFLSSYDGVWHSNGTRWDPVAAGTPYPVSAITGIGDAVFYIDQIRSHQLVRAKSW